LIESGASICNRNRIMTGVRFLFRVTLRRHDLAAEIWHIKEPDRLPPVLSPEGVKRVLTMATSLQARAMLTLAYGCGLRAGEVVRLRAGDVDSEQKIIRIVQSKGRKDRHVMLPAAVLKLLRGEVARVHIALMIAATLLRLDHRWPPLVAIKTAKETPNYAESDPTGLGLGC
jgi:integrase